MSRNLLTDEELIEEQEYQRLFESAGWNFYTRALEAELAELPSHAFATATDVRELDAFRVRARLLSEILAFEIMTKQRFEMLRTERGMEREQSEQDSRNDLL